MVSQLIFYVLVNFKTKKEISWRSLVESSTLKNKYSKSSNVCYFKLSQQTTFTSLLNI